MEKENSIRRALEKAKQDLDATRVGVQSDAITRRLWDALYILIRDVEDYLEPPVESPGPPDPPKVPLCGHCEQPMLQTESQRWVCGDEHCSEAAAPDCPYCRQGMRLDRDLGGWSCGERLCREAENPFTCKYCKERVKKLNFIGGCDKCYQMMLDEVKDLEEYDRAKAEEEKWCEHWSIAGDKILMLQVAEEAPLADYLLASHDVVRTGYCPDCRKRVKGHARWEG